MWLWEEDPEYKKAQARMLGVLMVLLFVTGLSTAWIKQDWAARHLHGGRKGGGGSRCRDARSASLRAWLGRVVIVRLISSRPASGSTRSR